MGRDWGKSPPRGWGVLLRRLRIHTNIIIISRALSNCQVSCLCLSKSPDASETLDHYRQLRRLCVRIHTVQPEPMGGNRAGSLTLGPMGQKGRGHV